MKRNIRAQMIPATLLGVLILCFLGVTRSPGQSAATGEARGRGASDAAIERFWDIYRGNEFDAIVEAQAQLGAALVQDPNNPTLYALLGATHFWRSGEYTRDPNAVWP